MFKHCCLIVALVLVSSTSKPENGNTVVNVKVEKSGLSDTVENLSQKAALGDSVAAAELSDYFFHNYDYRYKYWISVAAENGYPRAEFGMYKLLRVSDDPIKQRRAFFWLKKAASNGDQVSKLELSRCFPGENFDHHLDSCLGPYAN
jgi:hypothetical protein